MNIAPIAALAYLELSPEEAESMRADLASILDYVGQLSRIDTTGVEPMSQPLAVEAPLRDDAARPGFSQAEALANAPQAGDGMFQVPAVVAR